MTSPPEQRKEQIAWSISRGNGRSYNLNSSYRPPQAQSFQARQHFIAKVGKLVHVIHEGDGCTGESGVADLCQLRRHIVWIADQRIHAVTAKKSLPDRFERLRRERLAGKPFQFPQRIGGRGIDHLSCSIL